MKTSLSFRRVGRFAGLIFLFLAGCAVGPNYHRPPVTKPDGFRGETRTATNSIADLPWEQVFTDEHLQGLIHAALTNNYDLQIAATHVAQARELVAQARSQFLPQINYGAGVGKGKNVGTLNTPSPTGVSGGAFYGDINGTWEIDIWGQIRRMTESARAQYFATEEARRDVGAGLVAEIAQDYFQLLAFQRELEIARDTTNSYGDSLRIFSDRLKGGVSSKLETSSAEALLASAAATIPQLEQQVALQENQIQILLGLPPGSVDLGGSRLDDEHLPDVPAGLPSSLLERRPDIREAEDQLRAANAQVGVAVGNFFPQLDLTGMLGRTSTALSGVTGGGANAFAVAASLSGPLFHAGALRSQYRQALAARNQFALQFQAAVLYALQEVSDALIAREKLGAVRYEQARAVDAYKEAFRIAMERYQLGESSYYEVLQQQQLLFPAENTLVQTELTQLTTDIQLYRALGGAWQAAPPSPSSLSPSH